MRVVVLAAGFATRMYPLTRDRAKPLLDVAGRPVLSWILDRVLEIEGVREIVVVSNGRFAAQFRAWAEAFEAPCPLTVVDDGAQDNETRLGAIADLTLALQHSAAPEGPTLVVAGDNLLAFPLVPAAARFREQPDRALLLVRRIPGEVPPRTYSEVLLDDAGDVARIREKPADPESPLSATCLYFFPPRLDDWLAGYLADGGEPDAPGHFLVWLSARESLRAFPIDGAWFDIGSLASLETARQDFRPPTP